MLDRHPARLGRYDQYALDDLKAELRGDLPSQYERALLEAEARPGSMEAISEVAARALDVNRPAEAARLYSQIVSDPGWCNTSECHVNWGQLTSAEHMLGEYEQELVDAKRGRAQYPDLVTGLGDEIRALAALGRISEVEQLLDSAAHLHARGWTTYTSLLVSTARELHAHGHDEAARHVRERAKALYRSFPAPERQRYDWDYAAVLREEHRWSEAYVFSKRIAAQDTSNYWWLAQEGIDALGSGDRKEADRVAWILKHPGRQRLYGMDDEILAIFAAIEGDKARAVELLRQAFSEGRAFDAGRHTALYADFLRGYPPFEEWLRPKG